MNLSPETRKGYYISSETKKVWAVEMELLNKLLEVCNKHNLKVWAEGGTLLGTVREHGFIPWDDDIDMAMLREDYDKLQAIAKDEFQAPFFFQSGYTDQFPCGFSKLRMDGTAAIIPHEIHQRFHQGIFIDIFCYDAIPDDEKQLQELKERAEKSLREMKLYCSHYFSFTKIKRNIRTLFIVLKYKIKGFHNCFKEYDDLFKPYKIQDNRYISFMAFFFNFKKFKREKTWYDETLYLPFEDITMPVPSGYHEILTKQYGDYNIPQKCPTMHGEFEVLDTNRSYKEYLPILKKKHRYDAWQLRKKIFFKLVAHGNR